MGKAAAARRLASAAAYGGGGVSLIGASLLGVLTAEAKLARRAIGDPLGDPTPDATGWYGKGRPGPALKMALLGDSSAVGYGVDRVDQTPGAHLASGLAEGADRRVYLRSLAVVGAQTRDLGGQIDLALPMEPQVAVILIGANDVTHRVFPSESVRLLEHGVRRLREAGVEVVVGTCPDLGTVEPIAPPLRQVARAWSRRLAAGQTIAAIEAGGRTVSLGSILGPEFSASPKILFGPDQFHPSAAGYSSLASVLLPSVLAAVGVIPSEDLEPEAFRGEGVMPISYAAVEATKTPGTEIDGTEVGGAKRGARGRWVLLRHRRRRPQAPAEAPEHEGDAPGEHTEEAPAAG
ncbi:MAG TPA: SGNH/GDSL hydrolase family protein [Nocardioidaceae bacterium]|nr:SGNH/GDSL hydrolase family protein [Nocardioidaceae bacterium]